MESYDNKLKQLLNMYGIDADTGIPDFILAKFLCSITDLVTSTYLKLPDNENIGDIEEDSQLESFVVNDFADAFRVLVEDVRSYNASK